MKYKGPLFYIKNLFIGMILIALSTFSSQDVWAASCWQVTGWTVGNQAILSSASCSSTPSGYGWVEIIYGYSSTPLEDMDDTLHLLIDLDDVFLTYGLFMYNGLDVSGTPIVQHDIILGTGSNDGTATDPNPPNPSGQNDPDILDLVEKEIMLYSASPTHIQVVPLVTTGLPDLTTGVAVTTTTACVDDPMPPGNTILPVTGEWISIWFSENVDEACYSRFSANSSGGYDENYLGDWPLSWRIKGTDDLNSDGYDDLMLIARSDSVSTQAYYQYHTVLGQPDGSFDFDTFTPQIYSPNTWWSNGIVADVNGDGHSDFVYWAFPTGGSHSTTLQMLAGNGDGTFSPTPQTVFRSPHGANTVSFADFDQNGHSDFYLAPDDDVDDEGQSHIALNNGSDYTIAESLDFRPNKEGRTNDTFSAFAIAYDVNLDGNVDLATWEGEWRGQITAEVYWGDGTGTFTPSSEMLLPAYTFGDPQKPRLAWGKLYTINSEQGQIKGMKWYDLNNNGIQEADEPGLEGWTISLENAAGTVISTTTDPEGNYGFINLPAGTYSLTEVAQPGWTQTYPSSGVHTQLLEINDIVDGINFGNRQSNTGPDLYIKDTPLDAGIEPNPDGGPMWVSEDIWVRTSPDPNYQPYPFPENSPTWTPLPHEKPEYRDPKYSLPNYVYVRVRNRGNAPSTGTEVLRAYWAKASTGLAWDTQWVDYVTNTCGPDKLFGAEITKPRQNAATATPAERAAYIQAIVDVGTLPTFQFPDNISYWHKQNQIHTGGSPNRHGTPAFLPWHREYVNRYEALLQEADPTVKLLYWDWTTDPENSTGGFNFFTPAFMGASGRGTGGISVGTPFIPALSPPIVTRQLSSSPTPLAVSDASLLSNGAYQFFAPANEGWPNHNASHGYIGGSGDMSFLSTAAQDPFFFLLHTNVDRLWAQWQRNPTFLSRVDPTTAYDSNSSNVNTNLNMGPWDGAGSISPWTVADGYIVNKSPKHPSVVSPPIYDTAPLVIPILQPGEAVILQIPWYPPNPNDFSCFSDQGHFCLLGRIETDKNAPFGMTTPEITSVGTNTRNNNNIAWKNLTVVDDFPGAQRVASIIVRNVYTQPVPTALYFQNVFAPPARTASRFQSAEKDSPSFFEYGNIYVKFPPEIIERWRGNDGIDNEDVKLVDETTIQIGSSDARIQNILLEPEEAFSVDVTFELFNDYPLIQDIRPQWDLIQTGTPEDPDEVVGGQRFEIDFQRLAIIERESEWRYLDDGSTPNDEWTTVEFDDAQWLQGKAELGFGDDPFTTIRDPKLAHPYITTYFRRVFEVADPDFYRTLLLELKRDDGAIVYLNGKEIHRANLPTGVRTPETLALTEVTGLAEEIFYPTDVTEYLDLLRPGKNVIGIEIHQDSPDSQDLSFDLALIGNPITTQQAPNVSFAEPFDGALFQVGQMITVEVEAIDTDGEIIAVILSVGDLEIGIDDTPPYQFEWTDAPLGTHNLRATAYDNDSQQSTVDLSIAVVENLPPVIELVSTADGMMFQVGETIQASARASDPGGKVLYVEYYLINMAQMFTDETKVVGRIESPPYAFDLTGLTPGHYMLSVVAFDDLGLSSQSLPIGFHVHQVEDASISGTKWKDVDADGIWDSDEPGISGVILNLQTLDGTTIATTTTDVEGFYSFIGLEPNDYIVVCEPLDGMILTEQYVSNDDTTNSKFNPDTGQTRPITVFAGETADNMNAGLVWLPGIITGTVFEDANNNDIHDVGEGTLKDVIVLLLALDGTLLAETTTDNNGEYQLSSLDPKIGYVIQVNKPENTSFVAMDVGDDDTVDSDIDPETGRTYPIYLSADETVENIDAGVRNGSEITIIIGNPDGSAIRLKQASTFKVPLSIHNIPEEMNVGSFVIDIHYDDSLLKPLNCEGLSLDRFSIVCPIKKITGFVRINGLSVDSGSRNMDLAEVEWEAIGPAGSSAILRVDVRMLTDNNGLPLPYTTQEQSIYTEIHNTQVVIGHVDGSTMKVAQSQDIDIPVSIRDIPDSKDVHTATVKISYDPSVLEPVMCDNHPDGDFDTMLCNLTFAPGVIRVNGASDAGVSGNVNLALIKWKAVGFPDDSTTLEPEVSILGRVGDPPIDHTTQSQAVNTTRMGDVNCDGIISSVDALFILLFDVDKRTGSDQCPPEPGAIYLPACNVKGSGICNSVDALYILQCDVGRSNLFCPSANEFSIDSVEDSITQIEPTGHLELPAITTGRRFTATVRATGTNLGAIAGIVNYDPNQYHVVDCHDVLDEDSSGYCNPTYNKGQVRFNMVLPSGASDTVHVVDIEFEHVGDSLDNSTFEIDVTDFASLDGKPVVDGTLDIIGLPDVLPDEYWIHLPIIEK